MAKAVHRLGYYTHQEYQYTNILTYNTRAIIFYVAALTNIPWLFPLCDIVLFQPMFLYMRHSHEHLCETLRTKNYNEN